MGNQTSSLAEIKKKGDAYNKAVRRERAMPGLAHQMSSKRFKKDDPFAEQWKVREIDRCDRCRIILFFKENYQHFELSAGGSIHHNNISIYTLCVNVFVNSKRQDKSYPKILPAPLPCPREVDFQVLRGPP